MSSDNGSSDSSPLKQYFALLPDDEFVQHADSLNTQYWTALQIFNLSNTWFATWCQKFGYDPKTVGQSGFGGSTSAGPIAEGDVDGIKSLRLRTNQAKTYIRQQNILALGERPAFQAQATNLDATSQAQVALSGKAVEFMLAEANFDKVLNEAGDADSDYGSGIMVAAWQPDRGQMVDVEEPALDPTTKQPLMVAGDDGQPTPYKHKVQKRTGGPGIDMFYPWQVVRSVCDTGEDDWIILKQPISRYELAAMFKDKAEDIMKVPQTQQYGAWDAIGFTAAVISDDIVTLHHFYHRNCIAVPEGKWIGYLTGVPLWNTKCPVEQGLPVAEVVTTRFPNTTLGFPSSGDVVAMQEALDDILSAAISNIMRFKDQQLFYHDDIVLNEGSTAVKLPNPDSKPPTTVIYQQLPESSKFMFELLPAWMKETLGLNDAAMGRPEGANMSGAAIASLTQTAVKLQRPKQLSYELAMNKMANVCLELCKKNATNGFMVDLAGATDETEAKLFTQQDLQTIKKVRLTRSNPMLNTPPGKAMIWDSIKDQPKDVQRRVVEMYNTNSFEALFDIDTTQTNTIRWENEELQAGRDVVASVYDDPKIHMPEHRAQWDKIRMLPDTDPGKMPALQAFVRHFQSHSSAWLQMDETTGEMLGIPLPTAKQQMVSNSQSGQPFIQQPSAGAKQSAPGSLSMPKPTQPAQPAKPAQPHENMPQ